MSQTTNLGLEKPLGTDHYNVDVANANMDILDEAIESRALKSQVFTGTLTAAGWLGSTAPFTQTVAIEGLPADAGGDIGLPATTSDAQDKAARDARLRPINAQPAGSVSVRATGKKPTIDIPIVVIVRG